MFWHLLFAHFLADYPLQSNWIATNKNKFPVLALHAGTHLVTMLVLSGSAWREIWPFLLLLSTVHMGIDKLKISFTSRRPDWITLPYLVDQGLHYLTLAGFAWWIQQSRGSLAPLLDARLAIFGTGLLLTTHVSFISERVLAQRDPAYIQEVIKQRWPRSLARTFLWGGLVWLVTPQALLASGLAIRGDWPYFSGKFARRALLVDFVVVIVAFLWVQWALRVV
jgi:hypothetical protein